METLKISSIGMVTAPRSVERRMFWLQQQPAEIVAWLQQLSVNLCGKIHDSTLPSFSAATCADLGQNLLCGHLLDGPRGRELLGPKFVAAIWAARGLGQISPSRAEVLRNTFFDEADYLRCVDDSAYLMYHGFSELARGVAVQALRTTRRLYNDGREQGRTTLTVIQTLEAQVEPHMRAIHTEVLRALETAMSSTSVETPACQ